ncbi:MAG: SMI1/KNR4 family protein, partial [Pseudomonadota bacterium]
MAVEWVKILSSLRQYPTKAHRILGPCSEDRIATVEKELGTIPVPIKEMLRHFNGAHLFVDASPFISILGITPVPPLPELEWAPDWHLEVFTPYWRKTRNRPLDWIIAIGGFGELMIYEENGEIIEWDSDSGQWTKRRQT